MTRPPRLPQYTYAFAAQSFSLAAGASNVAQLEPTPAQARSLPEILRVVAIELRGTNRHPTTYGMRANVVCERIESDDRVFDTAPHECDGRVLRPVAWFLPWRSMRFRLCNHGTCAGLYTISVFARDMP